MRILFVHNRYLQSLGGEDAAVEAEIKLLTAKGHTVEALWFSNDHFGGNRVDRLKAGLAAIYNSRSKKIVEEAIAAFHPDVIHVHNFFFEASPSVFDAAWQQRIPVVLTIHNYRLLCVNSLLLRNGRVCEECVNSVFPWKGVLYRCYHHSAKESAMVGLIAATQKRKHTFSNKVSRILTPSSFMRDKLLHSSLGIRDESQISVKPNFTHDPGIGQVENREPSFLFVGRLSEEKGVDLLLQCFASLPDEKLIIAGSGPQEEKWKQQYGGHQHIIFSGQQSKEQVIELMKSCRALIFPSVWYEGLPMTIVEAFATGTPVIASRLGAMQEMIVPGKNGFLFERENIAALQQSIASMNERISQGDFRLYEGARQTWLEKYHPDICYREVMNIYESVIAENAAKRSAQS